MQFDSTEQTISWLRNRYREGTLDIRPPYQRKPVWTGRQKSVLIESILLGYPIPEIYIHNTTNPDGSEQYALVDGQQRIRTILQFTGVEAEEAEIEHNGFALDKLEPNEKYYNYTFEGMSDEEKSNFFSYKFSVRYLVSRSDYEIKEMFRRLNRFQAPLKPQELRNATYGGPFALLSARLADSEYWAENRIVTAASIRRMGDIEFVSELLIGVLHGPQGGSAEVIDEYYAIYEDYEGEFPDQHIVTRTFDKTLVLIRWMFKDIKATRWSNKTDFYSLFVAIAALLPEGRVPAAKAVEAGDLLQQFATEVANRRSDVDAAVSKQAADYVRAVERGANDKARRAERHRILLELLAPIFAPAQASL